MTTKGRLDGAASRGLVVALVAVAVSALCVSGAVATTSAKKKPKSAKTATTTTLATAKAGADITVSGAQSLTIKGTKVTCQLGSTSSNFYVQAADYPDLGPNGVLSLTIEPVSPANSVFKAVLNGTGYLEVPVSSPAALLKGKTFTMSGLTAPGSNGAITVNGTVVCP